MNDVRRQRERGTGCGCMGAAGNMSVGRSSGTHIGAQCIRQAEPWQRGPWQRMPQRRPAPALRSCLHAVNPFRLNAQHLQKAHRRARRSARTLVTPPAPYSYGMCHTQFGFPLPHTYNTPHAHLPPRPHLLRVRHHDRRTNQVPANTLR